ncbi:BrnA antitoxin family protein [Bordetella tumbae]|uniref:BrnA antitoxin family protein n=1 Tax=Bordetella tumbae TaxID=1649139 RepID=UPI0039EEB8BD
MKKPDPEMIDDQNPEWTEDMFRRAKPARDVLPPGLQAKLGIRRRGQQIAPTKIQTSVRYDADVLAAFKADGPGWQSRMNDALREWLREHRPTFR